MTDANDEPSPPIMDDEANARAEAVARAAHVAHLASLKPKPLLSRGIILLILVLLILLGVGLYLLLTFIIFAPATSSSINMPTTSPTAPTTWAPTHDSYGIEFVFSPTPVPTSIRSVFEQAKRKWQTVLVEPGVSPKPNVNSTLCGHAERTYNGFEQVDDLEIWVDVKPIDGRGGVLGYARPCGLVAAGSYRSVTGEMVFDSEDLENMLRIGTLLSVITHEMGHVLGLGSYWGPAFSKLVMEPNYTYTGLNGKLGYIEVGGIAGSSPPIELDGGQGTAYSHWDEHTFGSELMTGYITSSNSPLSRLTARALVDLGYQVNLEMVDTYLKPSPSPGGGNLRIANNRGVERHSAMDRAFLHSQPRFKLENA